MSTSDPRIHPVAARDEGRGAPPATLAWALLAVTQVVALLSFVVPVTLFRHDLPGREVVFELLPWLNAALLASALLLVAVTPRRRLIAVVLGLLVLPVSQVLTNLASSLAFDTPSNYEDFVAWQMAFGAISTALLVTAWGVARLRSRLWPLGLLAIPVVTGVQIAIGPQIEHTFWRLFGSGGSDVSLVVSFALSWCYSSLPFVAGGALCWVLDQVLGTREQHPFPDELPLTHRA